MSVRAKLRQRADRRAEKRAKVAEQASSVRSSVQEHAERLGASHLAQAPSNQMPATFHHLYSSRDDVLSVFEDASGHVVAVGTARLA